MKKKIVFSGFLMLACLSIGILSNTVNAEKQVAKNKAATSNRVEKTVSLQDESVTSRLSMGTGYSDKVSNVSQLTNGKLQIKTTSKSVISVGMGTRTKTVLKIDSEITSEFFFNTKLQKISFWWRR